MAFDSEPNEATRKTLDDIRRELDSEYGYVEIGEPAAVAPSEVAPGRRPAAAAPSEFPGDRRPGPALVDRRIAQDWREREDADEDTVDARLAHFREISDRHQAAMERRRPVSGRGTRRSGYLIAGLVGCIAGQVLVLAFLMVTRHGGQPDVLPTGVAGPSANEVATAAAPIRPAPADSQFSPETRPEAESAAVASLPPQPSGDLPPRIAPEPPTSSSRQPAVVSAATVRDSVPPSAVPEPRPAPARQPKVASANDLAESQARLRAALTEWLRTSARGVGPVQTTEPVIVLGPDGRSAKTYVSVASPIGLIPREQRWVLGPRGWRLVDDRQAGLPQPGSEPSSRER